MILEHFDTIHNSPSQIYQFALPFSPPSSWLHNHYTAELLQVLKVVKGAKAEWGTCSRMVLLDYHLFGLSYQNNIVAIGSINGDIITLDTITGSRMAVLSGHTDVVRCVTFSSDGRSLASGADDKTVKLWDMQTGGVVRTFLGHTRFVLSVSISADHTRIVSGSGDKTIYLWDVQTGHCLCTVMQQASVGHVGFSPIDSQHIISISGKEVWGWDLSGQQIQPTYDGTHIAFSPDCTRIALCNGGIVTVQGPNFRVIETQLHVDAGDAKHCCFSPDGRLIAAAAENTAYVWDITSQDSHLVGTLVGHTEEILSLIFSSSSSLISTSHDQSVRFWQIGVLPMDSVMANPESTQLHSSTILSVSLQARAGIAISSDIQGMVKTWDISTGICKESFQTPAMGNIRRDGRLIDGRLIFVWCQGKKIYIWGSNKDHHPKLVATLPYDLDGLRISGDGSIVFCLFEGSIQAWSIHTGEHVGEVELELKQRFYLDPLQMDGSKIWIRLMDSSTQGWDFGLSNTPVPLSGGPTERPLLDFIGGAPWYPREPPLVMSVVTGRAVFQFSRRYLWPKTTEWNGQYLVAGYGSGEVLILDFHHLYSH